MSSTHPKRLRTEAAAQYLKEEHGVIEAAKTLRNKRAEGKGPRWQYFGNVPYVTPGELDRYVEDTMSDRPANRRRGHALPEQAAA